ncbi:Phosphatidylinositol 4,5-bisphosphate 3-kinase catalytic subunit gamma isoform [Coelomomyces lativittatus]|nr:Phosphatidylinositol 4,5-bisphosphate 3-kinase catalytic subunit gamma isoform [Coelomomyces lativittatus]
MVRGSPSGVMLDQKIASNPHVNLCHALQLPISFQLVTKTSTTLSSSYGGFPMPDTTSSTPNLPIPATTSTTTSSNLKTTSKSQKNFPLNFSFQGKKTKFPFFKSTTKTEPPSPSSNQEKISGLFKKDNFQRSPNAFLSSTSNTKSSSDVSKTVLLNSDTEPRSKYGSTPLDLATSDSQTSSSPSPPLVSPPQDFHSIPNEMHSYSKGSFTCPPLPTAPSFPSTSMSILETKATSTWTSMATTKTPTPTPTPQLPASSLRPIQIPGIQTGLTYSPACSMESASFTSHMQPDHFLVRVYLDADASTLVACPPDATVTFLLEKVKKKYVHLNRGGGGSGSGSGSALRTATPTPSLEEEGPRTPSRSSSSSSSSSPSSLGSDMFLIDENYEVIHQCEQELRFLTSVVASFTSKRTPTFVLLPKEMDPSCRVPMEVTDVGWPTPYFAFLKLPKGLFSHFRIHSRMTVKYLEDHAVVKWRTVAALDGRLVGWTSSPLTEFQVFLSSTTLSEDSLKFPLSSSLVLMDLGLKSLCDPYSNFVTFKLSVPTSYEGTLDDKPIGLDIHTLFYSSFPEVPPSSPSFHLSSSSSSSFIPGTPPPRTPFQIHLNLAHEIHTQFYVHPTSPCSVLVEEARNRLRSIPGREMTKELSMYQLFFDWKGALRVLSFTEILGDIQGLQSILDAGEVPKFLLRLYSEKEGIGEKGLFLNSPKKEHEEQGSEVDSKPLPPYPVSEETHLFLKKEKVEGHEPKMNRVTHLEALQKKTCIITPEDVLRNLRLMEGVHLQRKQEELEQSQNRMDPTKLEKKEALDPPTVSLFTSSIPFSLLAFPSEMIQISPTNELFPTKHVELTLHVHLPFNPPDSPSFIVMPSCSMFMTLKEVKTKVWHHETMQPFGDPRTQEDIHRYFLLCERTGRDGGKEDPLLLVDETQFLGSISYVQKNPRLTQLVLHLVEKKKMDDETQLHFSRILGYPWSELDTINDPEVQLLRHRLHALHFYLPTPLLFQYSVDTTPLSNALISKLIASRFRLPLRLHFPHIHASKTMVCDAHELVKHVVQRVIEKFEETTVVSRKKEDNQLPPPSLPNQQKQEEGGEPHEKPRKEHKPSSPTSSSVSGLTLKFCGREEYLHLTHHVIDHTLIRQAILNDEKINLILVHEPIPSNSTSLTSKPLEVPSITSSTWMDHPYQVEEKEGPVGTHTELTLKGKDKDLSSVHCISLWDLFSNFRVEIKKIEIGGSCPGWNPTTDSFFIESYISFGTQPISKPVRTPYFPVSSSSRIQTYLIYDLAISNLPMNASIVFHLYVSPMPSTTTTTTTTTTTNLNGNPHSTSVTPPTTTTTTNTNLMTTTTAIPTSTPALLTLPMTSSSSLRRKQEPTEKKVDWTHLGSSEFKILDFRGRLRQGPCTVSMYPKEMKDMNGLLPLLPNDKYGTMTFPQLHLRFEEYSHPVVFPQFETMSLLTSSRFSSATPSPLTKKSFKDIPKEEAPALKRILKQDSLTPLDEMSQRLLWKWRSCLVKLPESLPKVMLSVAWHSVESVAQVKNLLNDYAPVLPETAFVLLEKRFADDDVRSFAIQHLEPFTHDEVQLYLIQLIQALSFEPRLDSMLVRFTLKRALMSTKLGHAFFWALRVGVFWM